MGRVLELCCILAVFALVVVAKPINDESGEPTNEESQPPGEPGEEIPDADSSSTSLGDDEPTTSLGVDEPTTSLGVDEPSVTPPETEQAPGEVPSTTFAESGKADVTKTTVLEVKKGTTKPNVKQEEDEETEKTTTEATTPSATSVKPTVTTDSNSARIISPSKMLYLVALTMLFVKISGFY